tara:strand:- start:481 stop:960 length:480 start_codon:yes stop_codon:yes gene_type:complete
MKNLFLNPKLITFTLLFGILINPIFSQKVKNQLSEIKLFGFLSVEYTQSIDLDNGDTITYVYMGYQNSEYTHITDIQSIVFLKKSDVESFITDIKKIVEFMGDKKDISFTRDEYYLGLYDFDSKRLRVGKDLKKTTVVFQKNVRKLIVWLEGLDLKYLR